jgi:hydrophobic/amphiphilic exporter-1 (mainly G- bacteria), HAE1 family
VGYPKVVSLPASALRRPVSTVSATVALVLLGVVSLGRIPVSLLPDVTLPVLTIRTDYPGAAAPEVSRFVAEPIEEAISATPGLLELRSVSRNDEVTTTARFGWGTDMATTVLNVRERLDNARGALPPTAARPTLLTSDPGDRPIAILALSGSGDLRALARTAKEVDARRLEQLDGVASVGVVGAPLDEIQIELDPERLRALDLTPEDVAQAVKNANAGAPGGTVRRGQFRFSVRALTEFASPDEIADTPVGPPGTLIRLADVGAVSLGTADQKTEVRLDGARALGLVVYKDAGSNTVTVTKRLYEAIEALRRELPEVKLTIVAAQAGFVTDALSNLAQEIVAGGALSLIVILLLMGNVRSSLAVALVVPLSVLISLVLLQALGVTINVLSLGGLALGVGMLVDNAIVVAEAAGRYRESGGLTLDATRRAAEELSGPLVVGTLTTLLVFGPIVFVRGLAAALFRDLSLSVAATLSASLLLALTLMPVMTVGRRGYMHPDKPEPPGPRWYGQLLKQLAPLGHRLAETYERGMVWSLARPRTVFAIAGTTVIVTAWMAWRLPREILPQVDEGVVVAALKLPEGTALEETARQVARIENAARRLGATSVYSRVGAATDEEVLSGADPGSAATAQLIIPVPLGYRAGLFADALRRAIPDLAAGALALDLAGQSEFGSLIGREGRAVRVEVSASEARDAERWADTVCLALRRLPTLVDVRDAYAASQPVIEISFERGLIARRGLSIDRVADALAGGLGGVEASELRQTDRRTPITVRLAGSANENLNAALATVVAGVPVGQLVRVKETQTPVEVVRVNQRPVTVIEAVAERGGTARAARDVTHVLDRLPRSPGLNWRVSGADVEQRRTASELGVVAVLSTALMFLVLAGEFGSFTTPLLVMTTVPLAGAGGIIVLWITGQSLNAVSLIGMVVMIGVADNDAVVKLDAIRRFRAQGYPIEQAVLLGGRQRLRAIAMTSLTTVAGVLPLALGIGSGGQLYQPLAAGVIGGSISATLVTFFLLPTVYVMTERGKERRRMSESR